MNTGHPRSNNRAIYLFPLFIAIYPVLYLYSENYGKLAAYDILKPSLLLIFFALGLCLFHRLLVKSWEQALIAAALVLVMFYSFVPILAYFGKCKALKSGGVEPSIFLYLTLAIWIIAVFFLRRIKKPLTQVCAFLSCVSACLIVVVIAPLVPKYAQDLLNPPQNFLGPTPPELEQTNVQRPHGSPNIYYIILDAYGRADTLQRVFKHNNTSFIEGLKQRGFFVAEKSYSNYPQTLLSLASSLNIDYLNELDKHVDLKYRKRGPLRAVVKNNHVAKILRQRGYKFVSFSSGYSGTDMNDVDLRMNPLLKLSEFENLLVSRSPIPYLLSILPFPELKSWQFSLHRHRIRYIFEQLGKLKIEPQSHFVFAHVLSPHPPFVFNAKGGAVSPNRRFRFLDGSQFPGTRKEYVVGYRLQITYLNQLILQMLDQLIARDPNALVILQGDHGPGSRLDWESVSRTDLTERMAILNAYRVPEEIRTQLYPSVSPVNTFRLIFNYLWGSKLKTIEDESYFATWSAPYNFIRVSDELKH